MKSPNNTNKLNFLNNNKIIFPAFFIILSIILLLLIPFYNIFFPKSINSTKNIEGLDSRKESYVEFNLQNLYYSNYSYFIDEREAGYYYYTIENNKATFVLISSKNLSSPEDVIDNYTGYARLSDFNPTHNQMLSYLAKDLNWTSKGITESSSNLIINEFEYRKPKFIIIFIAIIIMLLLSVYFLIVNIKKLTT